MNYTKRKLDDAVVLSQRFDDGINLYCVMEYIYIDGNWYERCITSVCYGKLHVVESKDKIAELYHAAWPEMYGEPQKKEQAQ
jgi:hypothetical protein